MTYRCLLCAAVADGEGDTERLVPTSFVNVPRVAYAEDQNDRLPATIRLPDGRLASRVRLPSSELYSGVYVIREPVTVAAPYADPFKDSSP